MNWVADYAGKQLKTEVDSSPHARIVAACDGGVPVTIVSITSHETMSGVLDKCGRHTVHITIDGEPPFCEEQIYCVTFVDQGRAQVFLTRAIEIRTGDAGGYVVFGMPTALSISDLRSAFRVPIADPEALQVTLNHMGSQWQGIAHDISFSGTLVELIDFDAHLTLNDTVTLELQHDALTVKLQASLRVVRDGKHAFFFPDSMNCGEVDPPEELRNIVRALEVVWIRRRQSD